MYMTPTSSPQTTTRYAIHTHGPSGTRYMTPGDGLTTADLAEAAQFDTRADAVAAVNATQWVAYGITEVSR